MENITPDPADFGGVKCDIYMNHPAFTLIASALGLILHRPIYLCEFFIVFHFFCEIRLCSVTV